MRPRTSQPSLTNAERGYGAEHRRTKDQWRPVVAAGRALCTEPICLMRSRAIAPTEPWDLAHDRGNPRRKYRGPAHRRCNRSEGATYGNVLRGVQPVHRVRSRRW